jgi:hypothetical protein
MQSKWLLPKKKRLDKSTVNHQSVYTLLKGAAENNI